MVIVFFQGEESTKSTYIMDDFGRGSMEERRVVPFAGMNDKGNERGVGLIFPDSDTGPYIWGNLSHGNLIDSYRGMKLLEEVPEIPLGMLCFCYESARYETADARIGYYDRKGLKLVNDSIGENRRLKIINQPLPDFTDAIKKLYDNRLPIDLREFRERGLEYVVPTYERPKPPSKGIWKSICEIFS